MNSPMERPFRHINLRVRGMDVSATLRINERSNELIRQGRKIYKFGLGQSPFPVESSVAAELCRHATQKDYLPVQGLWPLREAVANYHNRTQGLNYKPENVLIGPGSKELMFLLQLVYYGNLVIPTPSWVSYAPQAHILGRNVNWLGTTYADNWQLSPEELESYCHRDPDCPRLCILNYPANPTGHTYTDKELEELAEVARKYHIIMLSDEIYGELHHDGNHHSIAHYYPEGTIISAGLSKWCGAGGWRLGTFVFPDNLEWLQKAMGVVASETFTSTSTPIQYAAIKAYEGGPQIDEYLRLSRKILKALCNRLETKLTRAGLKMPTAQGAFYLFPDFSPFREKLALRGIKNSRQVVEHLLEEAGVAFLPGCDFGRPPGELTTRLSYVNFDGEAALAEAAAYGDRPLDDAFLEKCCPDTIEAGNKICDWVNG